MKRLQLSAAVLVALLATGQAFAADNDNTAKTRDQVKAELADAVRTGDALGAGPFGDLRLNQVNPSRYPAQPVAMGATREQVKAERADAIRTGDALGAGPFGDKKLKDVNPGRYPAPQASMSASREQVKAEAVNAIRNGHASGHGPFGEAA